MVTAATKKVTAWSFSRYSDYKACPAKFKYKHLDKLQEPPNAAMARGTAIHKLAEDYVKGELRTLPAELKLFAPEFKKLRAEKVKFVEDSWAFRSDWTETTWNDWTGCWLRVKLDAAYTNVKHNALVVIDHKTGKYREEKNSEYLEQLELYGVAGLVQHPNIDVVSPRLWYIDHGKIHPDPDEEEIEYFRKDEKLLRKKWEAKVKPMFTDSSFKPTPGAACTYCHYRKSNGGPCKF
jgi:CRISPR/Cas system-associated exonuclease Cas4 (RecB family)